MRLLEILERLFVAADWRGVAAQERAARAVAAVVQTSLQGIACFFYCILGKANDLLGDFDKAIEYHKEHLTMAKEAGNLTEGGKMHGNIGITYFTLGAIRRPSNTKHSTWRLQKRWATGRGRAARTGTSASRISGLGTILRPSNTTRST